MTEANRALSDGPDGAALGELLDADDARYLLARTGFTAPPDEVERYVGLSRGQAIDRLLAATRTVSATPLPDWAAQAPPPRAVRQAWTPDQRRAAQRERGQRYDELRAWWLGEMFVTPTPLTERMTLFWHNHFTSGQDKVEYPQLMAAQNALLRRYAFGRFGDLLHAVAKDPAMLLYLDGASNKRGRPNENFAREVMELFTLGEGHYSQRDVTEAARAYTGWSLDPDTFAYVFKPEQHDAALKTVLGQTGPFDGDRTLDILLAQPQTARWIMGKLWREFIGQPPDGDALEPLAARFRDSGYDLKLALRLLLSSPAFWDANHRGALVKSPAEFVAGTVRMFGIGYGDPAGFVPTLRALGQNLFYPPNVKGWPGGSNWINSSTLLAREQFVDQMFRSTAPLEAAPAQRGAGVPASAPRTDMAGARNGAMNAMSKPVPRGMRFDLDGWLAQFRTAPQAHSSVSTELQLQHAVLPLAPLAAIDPDTTSGAYLRVLLMDPVYQLK